MASSPRSAPAAPARRRPRRPAALIGSETPRLWTRPLRRLTRATSLGFEAADFARDVLEIELQPWQRWWLIHALELRPNGRFRFRTVLLLVARQNGKTLLIIVLIAWLMYTGRAMLVLGCAQDLATAREAWEAVVELATSDPELAAAVDFVRRANGEQTLKLVSSARYVIRAASRRAGRGLSVDLLLLDELREHQNWLAWGALSKTTNARANALILGVSNAGDETSVVLNSLRDKALKGDDETLGIFEWSGYDDCPMDDRKAWAQANPGLGHVIAESAIASALTTDPPAVFRTEVLCQVVDSIEPPPFDLTAWTDCRDPAGTMDALRDRLVLGLDVAPDGQHVTALMAGVGEGRRVRCEVVAAWPSTEAMRTELSEIIDRTDPRAIVWFPSGPAAAIANVLRGPELNEWRKRATRRLERLKDSKFKDPIVELRGAQVCEACEGLADLIRGRRIIHPADPLLDAHITGARKLETGEGWRPVRKGAGHVDAAYALAGASHVALIMPEPKKRRALVV